MNDYLVFGIGTALTYALSKVIGTPEPKQAKRGVRSTTVKASRLLAPRLTTHTGTVVQNSTVVPVDEVKPRKTKAHTGHGPFGFNQVEMTAARKNFQWSVGPAEYDDTITGWDEGLSEEEVTE